MFVVSDLDNIFVPQPDDLLVTLSESLDIIITLLDNLPTYFMSPTAVDTSFVSDL